MMQTLARCLVAVAIITASAASMADVLPVVADATGDTVACWWCDDASAHAASDLYLALQTRADASPIWAWPEADGADVSRVLRTPDLTPANARSLATLFGARHALVGTLRQDAAPGVPWLGLERVAWQLDAVLVDVRTGSEVDAISLRAVAFGESARGARAAAAELLLDRVEEHIVPLSADASDDGVALEQPVIVVPGTGTAAAYVAFRGALRGVHPGVIDVEEVWATEGQVALQLALDEGTDFAAVEAAIEGLIGAPLEGVVILDVERRDDRWFVSLATPNVE